MEAKLRLAPHAPGLGWLALLLVIHIIIIVITIMIIATIIY